MTGISSAPYQIGQTVLFYKPWLSGAVWIGTIVKIMEEEPEGTLYGIDTDEWYHLPTGGKVPAYQFVYAVHILLYL